MSTPERAEDHERQRDPSPRRSISEKCEVGSQASVEVADVGTQSNITLPNMVPALWHCQVPTSVIDMTPSQVEEAADSGGDGEEISSATEDTSISDIQPVRTQHDGNASREVSSHPPEDGRVSRNASVYSGDSDESDDVEVDEIGAQFDDIRAAQDASMDQALSGDDPMSPGQASGDTVMTEVSTQTFLSDIDDKPVSEYLPESDDNKPAVVKDLITMWDGLMDEGRWTTGELYYHDGSLAEGRVDISRLTYNKDGHDRYGRPRVQHWSKLIPRQDEPMASDRHIATLAAEQGTAKPRAAAKEAKKVGGRRLRMARGMTVDSGAADNVIPRRMVRGKFNRIRPSKGSRAGVHYVSASSARIPNEGECDFHFTTKDGEKENYTFQIAEVNKALCAVSYLVDRHNQVIFDKDDVTGLDISRIVNKKTGKTIQMTRERNVWTIDAFIDEEPHQNDDFGRQG